MRGTFDIHPEPHEFEAEVKVHAIGVPFSTITLSVGDFRLNVYGKADDALKLIRVAKLLNEVFASEKRECDVCGEMHDDVRTSFYPPVGDTSACAKCRGEDAEDSSQFGVGA